jgi:outer membrane lipoprotein-sorting protein
MSKQEAKSTSTRIWNLAVGLALVLLPSLSLGQTPTQPEAPKASVERIANFSKPTLNADAVTTEVVRKQPSPEIQNILKELESRHANLKTLQAEFGQVKTQQLLDFGENRTQGKLFVERLGADQPGRLRYDLEGEKGDQGIAPSSLLFVNNTVFDYVPVQKQVNKCTLKAEDAREEFRRMLLCFGVSSQEILSSYNVETAGTVPESAKTEKPLVGLSFTPLKKEVRARIVNISIWLDRDTLLPHAIRYEEVSGEVTTLSIRSLKLNEPIQAALFEPKWPKKVQIVDYTEE